MKKKKRRRRRRRREKVNETSNRFQIPNTPLLCFLCFLRNQTGLRERNSNKKGNPKQKITTNHARHSLQQFKYHFLNPTKKKNKKLIFKKKKLHRKKQQSYEFEHIRYTYIHIYMQRERERKGKLTGLKVFFISSFCCFAFWENQKHAQKVFVQIMREREREERERVRLLKLQKRRKGREV